MRICIKTPFLLPALIAALGLMPAGRVAAQAFATLHNLAIFDTLNGHTNSDGESPHGGLILSGNLLYGTTSGGGTNGFGTIFVVNTAGTGFTNVHNFSSSSNDGSGPLAGVILSGSTLYGESDSGGTTGNGTVFAVNTDGTSYTNLHSFTARIGFAGGYGTNSDGASPWDGIILSGNTLYGTTQIGGTNAYGTIFAVNTDGTGFTILHHFTTPSGTAGLGYGVNSDGIFSRGKLLLSGGRLYGTAIAGGTNGYGTIFAVNTDGTGFTTLHTFTALDKSAYPYTNSDGVIPEGGLILSGGTLYGTASGGGAGGGGTVFAVHTDGTGFTNVYSFPHDAALNYPNGAGPDSGLILSGNILQGTTTGGGTMGDGTVFAVNTDGTGFTKLHNFTAHNQYDGINDDGSDPEGGLILSGNILYGTTTAGGTGGNGIVFALDLAAAPPPIQFTASPTNGTVPLSVQFNAPSYDNGGNPLTNWNWNFGDGGISTNQNPAHVYYITGSYSPALVTTNYLGGTVAATGPAISVSAPASTIEYTASPTNGTAPLTVQFNAPGMDDAGYAIASWQWDFGDGSTSTAQNPSHVYNLAGSYAPSLTAGNVYGGTDSGHGPSVSVAPAPPGVPGLVAHYSFDDGNLNATDVSGNGNDLGYPFEYDGGSVAITNDALAGDYAAAFDNGGSGVDYYYTSNSNLLATLTGSFSVSLWVKTTQVSGSDTDDGLYDNVGIVSTYAETVVPLALTGSKVAFVTDSAAQDTLHSADSINTGLYVHVVVTRDQGTGQKNIYINGAPDASDVAETGLLDDPVELDIGSENGNGFDGEMDDIQIYTNVLSAGDVLQLYNNPGTTLTNATTAPPAPVSVSFDLQIQRYQDLTSGYADYEASPDITFTDPAPVTTNSVVSPDGAMFSEVWAGDSSQDNGSGEGFNSLDDLIYACTNSPWTLYINQGDPSEQVFQFRVSISGLTTSLLASVTVLVPTNNAVNVATNSPFQWSGPTNYSSVYVEAYQQYPGFAFDGYTSLPGNATSWPSPPALFYGTNYFYVSYSSNYFPDVTFTTPVDSSLNPVSSWDTEVDLYSDTFMSFVVGAPAPLPVQLTGSPSQTGDGKFQLSFQTLAGRPESIQVRTNLGSGAWMEVTNFMGDGSVQQFHFPTTNPAEEYFRVITR